MNFNSIGHLKQSERVLTEINSNLQEKIVKISSCYGQNSTTKHYLTIRVNYLFVQNTISKHLCFKTFDKNLSRIRGKKQMTAEFFKNVDRILIGILNLICIDTK